MTTLEQYRKNAGEHNLCSEYVNIWDSCKSKKEVVDMGLGAKGIDYLCDTIAKGWGISSDVISERFKSFINGKYVSQQDGYTSKLYCNYNGNIFADTTIVGVIDSDVEIEVKDFNICEIYVTGKCHIIAKGNGRAVFICYGNPNDIEISFQNKAFKRINKKDRDRYEQRL